MIRQILFTVILCGALWSMALPASESVPLHPELKAFPAAREGQERFVIVLPHKERGEEDAFLVELVPGKTMETDGVNQMRLNCRIESKPLTGWGYTFYEITGSDQAISTLMAPPPGTPKVEKFVSGTSLKIPYNSRLPIVVYAPKGFEMRYRVWEAPEELTAALTDADANAKQTESKDTSEKPSTQSFLCHPIGTVRKEGDKTTIVLDKQYQDGLLRVDQLTHIFVFWWFDQNDTPEKRAILQVHPRGNRENPLSGVFATRSPFRPNLIAQTRCKVISVKENVIEIDTIDAFDKTPVLDIKPASIPDWIKPDEAETKAQE